MYSQDIRAGNLTLTLSVSHIRLESSFDFRTNANQHTHHGALTCDLGGEG